jgi:hypothetical protein
MPIPTIFVSLLLLAGTMICPDATRLLISSDESISSVATFMISLVISPFAALSSCVIEVSF